MVISLSPTSRMAPLAWHFLRSEKHVAHRLAVPFDHGRDREADASVEFRTARWYLSGDKKAQYVVNMAGRLRSDK
ncbi:MAG: hypothetical protein KatS3mg111_2367 [Pirellulaceae bacterium]|nr:MAG: hypothetical protein KatS3mg111_2367 [Pirellulaceae bacterium]